MAICKSCSKMSKSEDLFCLNCGKLLKDYENIRYASIDYNLTGDKFFKQIANEFQESSNEYGNIMSDFSRSLDRHAAELNDVSEKLNKSAITYEIYVNSLIGIFKGFSYEFENLIHSLNDVVFRILSLSNVIWRQCLNSPELSKSHEKSYDSMIQSLKSLVRECRNSRASLKSVNIINQNRDFENSKGDALSSLTHLITFHESFVRELNFIKDKYVNNNYMSNEDNHNHFCIYCGARIDFGQNFCSECGKPVYKKEPEVRRVPSEYEDKIAELEVEYDVKQTKAKELVGKIFDPDHLAYQKFTSSITKSNNLFSTQVDIAKKMAEMDMNKNPFVEKELDGKLVTLQAFIDKMDDLINELIIHMGSNKEDTDDINNLFKDMDDLIDSVKDY